MKTRLALVAHRNACEGIWSSSKGNESGVRITNLVSGERIRVDIEVGELKDSITFDAPGVFPLPWKRFERYRVAKIIDGDMVTLSHTTVEVVLNGSTARLLGPPDNSERSNNE